jgi:hypothetical protein
MGTGLRKADEGVDALAELVGELRGLTLRLLEQTDHGAPANSDGEEDSAARLAGVIEQLSLLGRVQHGMLLQFLARAHETRALPGGAPTWLAKTQGLSNGRARTLTRDAKRLVSDQEISTGLIEGRFSLDAARLLARYKEAIADTILDTPRTISEAITRIETDGVTAASRQIPRLEEHLDPEQEEELFARQRARSHARVSRTEQGMYRFGMLLDYERAAYLMTALDCYSNTVIQNRHLEGTYTLPADVRTVEQIRAEAFSRMAQVFLDASDEQRGIAFAVPAILYGTLDPDRPTVETLYGDQLPASRMPKSGDSNVDLIHFDRDGQPVAVNGEAVDPGSALARLAGNTHTQRKAIALRDRRCQEPGCTRRVAWSPLRAQDIKPFKHGGLTELRNLVRYCDEHQPDAQRPAD